jgi:type I restriction enzyme M protein
LIDALADMWAKVDRKSISASEKAQIKKRIANNNIVGVDIANAPKLARIARLNMYLHGDGGTRIFHLNALDKALRDASTDGPETTKEKPELRKLFSGEGFDVALTNPPFAKAYDRTTDEESRILDSYKLGRTGSGPRGSVRSCLLFAERYHDLLRVGGRWITVIDDGILSGDAYADFRNTIREWFIIRAVISLPGDAFQRSNARVKTSYLIAEKRDPEVNQTQPPVFMYPCQYVGIDDPKRQRARAGDAEARQLAEEEIATVLAEFERFQNGDSPKYTVLGERISDRLDVKNCLMTTGRSVTKWRRAGMRVLRISDVLEGRAYEDDEIVLRDHPEKVRVLVVRYEGIAEEGDEILPSEGTYARLFPVYAGDIVISNIAASYGSIAVVPDELDGCVVSSEYTVLKVKDAFDPVVVQLVLRSPEVRADILLSASGANRTRARWNAIRDIQIPYPKADMVAKVKALTTEAEAARRRATTAIEDAREKVESSLLLRSEAADTILAAFKPPK